MRRDLLTATLFTSAIAAVFVINMILPDKTFSDQENRTLQTWPTMTLSSVKSGKWAEHMEDYVIDQFVLRDEFIGTKAELELMLGKQENNGVFLSKVNTLIEKNDSPDYAVVDANIDAINQFKNQLDIPVYTSIVPGQSLVWSAVLPDNAPTYNQSILLEYVDQELDHVIDMSSEINSKEEEYIYYYTDHHWTTLGAYYGYKSICDSINIEPVELDNYTGTQASDNFLGSWYNQSGIGRVEKDSIYLYVPNQEAIAINGTEESKIQIYEESYIDSHDKYTLFFGGIML